MLRWLDYVLLVVCLGVSIGIGIFHGFTGGKQKTTSEFLLANRRLKVIPTMISLLVSFQSAIMILGNTTEMYMRGVQVWVVSIIAYCFSLLLVERTIVPWIYPLKLTSIYDYLELRYKSRVVKGIGVGIGITQALLYNGVAMFAPSIALEAATGLSVYWGIPIMAAVCTIYTAVGGMRAVIWTDVFQFGVMLGGMLMIFIKGLIDVGGPGNVFEAASKEGRLIYAEWSLDPRTRHTVWGLLLAQAVGFTQAYGLSQTSLQRYTATQTQREASQILLLNIPCLIVFKFLACFIGVIVLAYYSQQQCDPLAAGQITNSNQLLPYFVVESFDNLPGFAGIFLATLYSGALSSVSSSLSAFSAITWSNIIKPNFGEKLTESQAALINRISVVFAGVLSTGIAFLAVLMPGPITQISGTVHGSVSGANLALFIIGGCFKGAEWIGVTVGSITSVIVMTSLAIGGGTLRGRHQPPLPPVSTANCTTHLPENHTTYTDKHNNYTSFLDPGSYRPNDYKLEGIENIYAISYVWYSLIGLLISVVVSLLVSSIVRALKKGHDSDGEIPEELMVPMRKILMCRTGVKDKKQIEDKDKELEEIEEQDTLLETKGI